MGIEDKNAGPEWKWRRECPKFNGIYSEYKGWRGQVEDWLEVCGEVKYPGIEIRMSLKGKALEVTEDIEREKLKREDGPQVILKKKLDEVFQKDTLMENYSKMKNYFRIEREASEKMRDFVVRYEKVESECRKAVGKSMFEGEAKGFHVLERANLTESQKQMVLAACGQGKLEYNIVSQIMKRIFEGLGSKEESEWWGSEEFVNLGRGRGNR